MRVCRTWKSVRDLSLHLKTLILFLSGRKTMSIIGQVQPAKMRLNEWSYLPVLLNLLQMEILSTCRFVDIGNGNSLYPPVSHLLFSRKLLPVIVVDKIDP